MAVLREVCFVRQRREKEGARARTEPASPPPTVEGVEQIAAIAGASLDDTAPLAAVPSALMAAAYDPQLKGLPAHVAAGGTDVIAVIGDEGGDPHEWWGVIHALASRLRAAS
jgi:hypothetical protein